MPRPDLDAAERTLLDGWASSDDAALAYAATAASEGPASAEADLALRGRVADSAIARQLLRVFEQDDRTLGQTYRKYQGVHWTLVFLAMIGYPPGDERLRPLVTRAHDWMFSDTLLRNPRSTLVHPGQEDRVRHCASMDGNVVWYTVVLGLAEERTAAIVDRLIGWQWPDGGWNCDKSPGATHSSFQESLIPARGLAAYGRAHDHRPATDAAARVAELALSRRLLWHSDGRLIEPAWGRPGPDRIHYPTQFFDVLFALQVMTEIGRLDDPRCADALALLKSKQLPDGTFPLEAPTVVTSDTVRSRGSYANWGPAGPRRGNPLVTASALGVLRQALVQAAGSDA